MVRKRDSVLEAYRHRFHYALAGVLLSAGAPLGLLLLRTLVLALGSQDAIRTELASHRIVYLYVSATTMIAFGLFGYVLGRQTDKLQRLSTTDALTGLGNRRGLNAHLKQEHSRSRRYRAPLSLLLIDVDELKRINDDQGHAAGDDVIRRFASAIKATARDTDIGGRWGGDEFLIIAPSTGGGDALTLAERLRFQLAQQWTVGEAAATASIGVATFGPNRSLPEDPETLVQAADAALRQAKTAGRNTVTTARS